MIKSKYNEYLSEENVSVPKKVLYSDSDGFPNELAFRDFCGMLTEADDYRLICVNFDLTTSNNIKGYAYGTLVLRKLYIQLQEHYFIFRVSGDKFNVISKAEQVEALLNTFNAYPADYTTVYYGAVDDIPVTKDNYTALRKLGKELMYKHKAMKTNRKYTEVCEDVIVGNKGNVPAELLETETHKFKETMWFAEIHFEQTEPIARNVTAHIYITEFKKFPAALNMVIVMEDQNHIKAYSGNIVTVGFNGNKFDINARIDDDGKLIIQCFPNKLNPNKIAISIDKYEGNYIPVNFGKRISKSLELYPIRPNVYGAYDYVLWDNKERTATVDTTGLIEIKGKKYSVRFNNKGIDLIDVETEA